MKQIAAIFLMLLAVACVSKQKAIVQKSAEIEQIIIFGSGGGFTGEYKTYELHKDGKLMYKRSIPSKKDEPVLLTTLSYNKTRAFFKEINATAIKINNYNKPDNMSYFLSLKEGEKEYSLTWGGINHPSPQIEALYKKLNTLINTSK